MNSTITLTDDCDRAAYQTWSSGQVRPAYVRGLPSWLWQSAFCRNQRRRTAVTAL